MGPGWFPAALGVILALFGVFLMARGIGWPEKSPGPVAWGWRAPLCIVVSMLAFGFLMPRFGLVPALAALFLVPSLGGREDRWLEELLLSARMTALAVAGVVYLLNLRFERARGFHSVWGPRRAFVRFFCHAKSP